MIYKNEVYIKPNVRFESDGSPKEHHSGYDIFHPVISRISI